MFYLERYFVLACVENHRNAPELAKKFFDQYFELGHEDVLLVREAKDIVSKLEGDV
jgi:hypothetical protein